MAGKDESELIRGDAGSHFDRWALPCFDEPGPAPPAAPLPEVPPVVEEVAAEDVQPLSVEELEAIRQDAYNEGFSTGEKDGFRAGQLKARQEAEAALNERLQRLEQLMRQLFEPIADQDVELEKALVGLVSHITREVIQRELSIDSSQVRRVLREALKLLPMGAQNLCIYVNPQDFELVKALRERHQENWRILEDDALLPGGCRIETEHSRLDASIETRLAQAVKQLFEHQREQVGNPPPADIILDLDGADAS